MCALQFTQTGLHKGHQATQLALELQKDADMCSQQSHLPCAEDADDKNNNSSYSCTRDIPISQDADNSDLFVTATPEDNKEIDKAGTTELGSVDNRLGAVESAECDQDDGDKLDTVQPAEFGRAAITNDHSSGAVEYAGTDGMAGVQSAGVSLADADANELGIVHSVESPDEFRPNSDTAQSAEKTAVDAYQAPAAVDSIQSIPGEDSDTLHSVISQLISVHSGNNVSSLMLSICGKELFVPLGHPLALHIHSFLQFAYKA